MRAALTGCLEQEFSGGGPLELKNDKIYTIHSGSIAITVARRSTAMIYLLAHVI